MPPYLKPIKRFPVCNKQEDLKRSAYSYERIRKKYLPMACERISRLYFAEGIPSDYMDPNATWRFSIVYPKYARIITQSKEVDIHALIGNIGGYVGLFLGITMLH